MIANTSRSMDADRTILILSGYLCGIFASATHESAATFVFFVCAFALDLFWSSWFVIPIALFALLGFTVLRRQEILDTSAKLVVLGILGSMTASMWHQKTWFCHTVRGGFEIANLGTPFLFGFYSHDGLLGTITTVSDVFRRIVHLVVCFQLLWLLTPLHDVGGLHDMNVKILVGTGALSMILRDASLAVVTIVPTLLFVLYIAYLSPHSNPSSNRGEFPGGAKLTTLYFFVFVLHGLCAS